MVEEQKSKKELLEENSKLRKQVEELEALSALYLRIEENLRTSRSMLWLVMDNIPQYIYWKDRSLTYLGANKNYTNLVGEQSPETIIGKTDHQLNWPKEKADYLRQKDEWVMDLNKAEYHSIESYFNPNGKLIYLDVYRIPLHDVKDKVVGVFGIAEDITKRKKMEEALQESGKRYYTLFEGIDDAVFVHDMQGKILDSNLAACRRLGYSREELLKMKTSDIDDKFFAKGFKERLDTQLKQGRYVCEGIHVTKAGKRIPVDINTSVINYKGKTAVLALMRDITLRKQAESKLKRSENKLKLALAHLEEAHSRLKDLDKMKSDFISSVSHDLRTPLTSIKNAVSLLLKGGLQKKALNSDEKELLEIILNNTNRQTHMISDLLDISKIEAGKMDVKFEKTNFNDLLKDVLKTFQPQADSKNISLNFSASNGRINLEIDSEHIRRAINNLIENAIKFTPEKGKVSICLSKREANILLEIKDTGIGVSKDDQNKLFQKFYRVPHVKSQYKGGSGLGLAIAKGIINAHGGRIGIKSNLGEGSNFYFTIPYKRDK